MLELLPPKQVTRMKLLALASPSHSHCRHLGSESADRRSLPLSNSALKKSSFPIIHLTNSSISESRDSFHRGINIQGRVCHLWLEWLVNTNLPVKVKNTTNDWTLHKVPLGHELKTKKRTVSRWTAQDLHSEERWPNIAAPEQGGDFIGEPELLTDRMVPGRLGSEISALYTGTEQRLPFTCQLGANTWHLEQRRTSVTAGETLQEKDF